MATNATHSALLRRAGLRRTRQRALILDLLREVRGHITAGAVVERVREQDAAINPSTVYRTLTALRDAGLISETDLGAGERSYAWRQAERHHHLVCRRCGREFELDHAYLQPLEEALARDLGFTATLDHFAIWGFCTACRPYAEEA